MRGCLSVTVLGLAFLGAIVWFAGPQVASAIIATTLSGRGLAADRLDVEVVADPPLELELHGSADAAETAIQIDAADVESVAVTAFEAEFGIMPSSASLVAPNEIRVVLGGLAVSARLSIDHGSIVATANGTPIRLFAPNPGLPLRLATLAATSLGLELRGTFDAGALLR